MRYVVHYYAELEPENPADLDELLQRTVDGLFDQVDYIGTSAGRVVIVTEHVHQEV